MIDQRTTYFGFRMPHPSNALNEDVLRLRTSLTGIDDMFNWATELLTSDDPILGKMQALVDAAKAMDAQIQWVEPSVSATMTYDANGLLTGIVETLPGGLTRTADYTYAAGIVQTETVTIGAVSYLTTYTYTNGLLTGAVRVLVTQ